MSRFLYLLHRALFILTGGLWNDLLSLLIKIFRKKKKLNILQDDPFFKIQDEKSSFLKSMNKNGYYIFNYKIPEKLITEINQEIAKQEYNIRNVNNNTKLAYYKDFHNSPESNRYDLATNRILSIKKLANLSSSQTLVKLAQSYLQTKPILDLITLWWSYPTDNNNLKNINAQMYHFDMDKIKFIKFFLYLTNVEKENGPHCLYKGSHNKLPIKLRKKGRFTDQEVAQAYGADKEIKITGSPGSIIAVDTRCIHKGDPILKDSRCIFQLQFSNSTFGKKYDDVIAPRFVNALKEKKIYDEFIYQLFRE
ncbi:phytanoyl-CoA dioxygenase PhyH domain protein [Bacteriovorax sp. BAL6_X]|uniref:phytanoyl-CoA dioxygenase family protein n=1 Tax=Bacteriovorax sp. BAL6_X TaxID=1201290 RepID=UPI00038608AC|nr:phytanoyl-CoA dioxygenase family protein [Bacteriovorax sp. BAL6_X]EPZ50432.1 phytanoyl-CoA dioxygenase PhyH domain protein [Bacteriovorax sp. BAL6_X]